MLALVIIAISIALWARILWAVLPQALRLQKQTRQGALLAVKLFMLPRLQPKMQAKVATLLLALFQIKVS